MHNLEQIFSFAVKKLTNLQPNSADSMVQELVAEYKNKTEASVDSHPTSGGVDKNKDPGRFSGFANGAE